MNLKNIILVCCAIHFFSVFSMEQQKRELVDKALMQANKDGSLEIVKLLSELKTLMQPQKPQEQSWTQPASPK